MIFDDPAAISAADLASTVSPFIVAFWNTVAAGATNAIASYIGNRIARLSNTSKITGYRLNDGPAHTVTLPEGPPVYSEDFTLGASGSGDAGGDFPAEVALCISFHGSEDGLALAVGGVGKTHKGGTRPASRVRGRCYIGPFNPSVMASPSSDFPMNHLVTDLAAAGGALRGSAPSWSVWSRKNGTCVAINGGFVDDEWDTVRRRRIKASFRTTF